MATKSSKRTKGSKPLRSEEYTINDNISLTCYEWDNRETAKLTIANAFVIFCTIVHYKDDIFLSYPSYKNKKDDYQQLAYCFDKKVNVKIGKILNDFCEGEDEDDIL